MKRMVIAGAVGAGISLASLLGAMFSKALWVLYLAFPGVWLSYIAVGMTGINVGWNPILIRILMTIVNAAIYGTIFYVGMSCKIGWRT